jgi:hypothetical protein
MNLVVAQANISLATRLVGLLAVTNHPLNCVSRMRL